VFITLHLVQVISESQSVKSIQCISRHLTGCNSSTTHHHYVLVLVFVVTSNQAETFIQRKSFW